MYKIGDKVFVIDAQRGIDQMQKMIGKVCTIKSGIDGSWELNELPAFLWCNEWFSPATDIKVEEDDILSVIGE